MRSVRVRLATRAITDLQTSYSTEYKARARNLEKIGEYSFAIILYWNRLEAILKLLHYYRNITHDYPDKLNFITRSWNSMKNLETHSPAEYRIVFGSKNREPGSLWHKRNHIVHANVLTSSTEYHVFKKSVGTVIQHLLTNLPSSEDLARKNFLSHRKKALAGK